MNKKTGRPRSAQTEQAILAASYDLLLENNFAAITVDKIAERAKVSKATIYKWWPNKAAVIMDSFMATASAKLPPPDTGSAIKDITLQATNLANFLNTHEGKILTALIGHGQSDTGLAEAYLQRYFKPRRLDSHHILKRGIASGEFRADIDIELSIDLIYAPIFYRLLITHEPVNDRFVNKVIQTLLLGIQGALQKKEHK
ncbi:TetR/AcrR family transcriptional regulator [Propionispira raffinosivorans]|uniref:TetR/AcrR family transcriptional regulator n=1 Tax=Propionispira raffinosivorans TaxID=86959 RepID=UPI00036DA95B|nr:TetR/AcrR family transcriptional regulator [Propionispira raffinosivorans]